MVSTHLGSRSAIQPQADQRRGERYRRHDQERDGEVRQQRLSDGPTASMDAASTAADTAMPSVSDICWNVV